MRNITGELYRQNLILRKRFLALLQKYFVHIDRPGRELAEDLGLAVDHRLAITGWQSPR